MKMPFGKHKGKPIETLPRTYLVWLQTNIELHGELKAAIEACLTGLPGKQDIAARVEAIVKPWGENG
jgi:uncharacterized protein (DUF3820 family)